MLGLCHATRDLLPIQNDHRVGCTCGRPMADSSMVYSKSLENHKRARVLIRATIRASIHCVRLWLFPASRLYTKEVSTNSRRIRIFNSIAETKTWAAILPPFGGKKQRNNKAVKLKNSIPKHDCLCICSMTIAQAGGYAKLLKRDKPNRRWQR